MLIGDYPCASSVRYRDCIDIDVLSPGEVATDKWGKEVRRQHGCIHTDTHTALHAAPAQTRLLQCYVPPATWCLVPQRPMPWCPRARLQCLIPRPALCLQCSIPAACPASPSSLTATHRHSPPLTAIQRDSPQLTVTRFSRANLGGAGSTTVSSKTICLYVYHTAPPPPPIRTTPPTSSTSTASTTLNISTTRCFVLNVLELPGPRGSSCAACSQGRARSVSYVVPELPLMLGSRATSSA